MDRKELLEAIDEGTAAAAAAVHWGLRDDGTWGYMEREERTPPPPPVRRPKRTHNTARKRRRAERGII